MAQGYIENSYAEGVLQGRWSAQVTQPGWFGD